jgi:hypothetical protein
MSVCAIPMQLHRELLHPLHHRAIQMQREDAAVPTCASAILWTGASEQPVIGL